MTATGPRPGNKPADAVSRAYSKVGAGTYHLGATDADASLEVFDCFGFCVRWAYKLPGHRPGFNVGPWATVSDDLNSNSAIEDAKHASELFDIVSDAPRVGDILAYPTIRLPGVDAGPWIGHAAIVVNVARTFAAWDVGAPLYRLLDIIECVGPDGNHPAIRKSTGQGFDQHSVTWPKPEHRSYLLRVKP